jgi:hypothetical protein
MSRLLTCFCSLLPACLDLRSRRCCVRGADVGPKSTCGAVGPAPVAHCSLTTRSLLQRTRSLSSGPIAGLLCLALLHLDYYCYYCCCYYYHYYYYHYYYYHCAPSTAHQSTIETLSKHYRSAIDRLAVPSSLTLTSTCTRAHQRNTFQRRGASFDSLLERDETASEASSSSSSPSSSLVVVVCQ